VFFIVPTAFLSLDPSLIGAVVLGLLLMMLLGFTLMAVGVLPWVERVVMACIGWAFGPSADMARRNLARHRRRNVTTSLMFALSVSFVLFIASLVALLSHAHISVLEQLNGADLRIQAGESPDPKVEKELAGVGGVEGISATLTLIGRTDRGVAYDVVMGDIVGMKSLWVVPFGVDEHFEEVLYSGLIKYEEGGPEALSKLAADEGKMGPDTYPPVILSLSAARYLDVHKDDVVEIRFMLGAKRTEGRFRIEAVCAAIPGFANFRARVAHAVGSGVLLSLPTYRAMTRPAPSHALRTQYFLKADDDPKAVARRIREKYGLRYSFGVSSTAEQKEQAEILYWTTQVFFGMLLAVSVLIAVFCLIASMATTVIERRWEIGVLKAIGLRRKHLFQIFLGEAVALTLSAGIAGGAIGFMLAYMFVLQAAALAEMPIVFTMPYIPVFATFLVSVLAGMIAAWLPTRRVLKKSATEILRLTD
ncbi:MAG: ABC transporter permease, partial [Planctomycetota bacterium]